MNRTIAAVMFVTAVAAGASAARAASAPGAAPVVFASDALYKRMLTVDEDVRSYTATAKFDVSLKTFPYISPSLDGTLYYRRPDKQAVVFDTVPALASQFKKVYPALDRPAIWPGKYDVTRTGDASGTTTFRLVPKTAGRVDHLDVKVSDADATIVGYVWSYKDGGTVGFDQTYRNIGGDYFIDKQVGKVDLPSYKADVSSVFSDYKLNVAIPDSVFEDK